MQIPILYKIIIASAIVLLTYFLLRIDVSLTWKSVLATSIAYIFLCSRIQYAFEHRLLLEQFKNALFTSLLLDMLLISILFYFLHPMLGIITGTLAFVISVYRSKHENTSRIKPVIPSPFFAKGSYLWHSKVRYLLPTMWILILLLIAIARFHENYNLAAVSFGFGSFISFISTILQEEKPAFIQVYTTRTHFIQCNFKETIYNTAVFMLVPVIVMLLFFPDKWLISLMICLVLMLLSVKLTVTKYAFYPTVTLASVIFIINTFAMGALIVSVYGVVLIPIILTLLYRQYRKNVSQLIFTNETIEY